MSLLTASDLGLAHGDFDVFSGISLAIPNDARIGLVGPNGIGKTTLLQILAGAIEPTSGAVHLARDRRIGYLRQEAVDAFAARHHSVLEEMNTVFAYLHDQAAALRAMEARMAEGDHCEELVQRYGTAQHAFEHAGGYDYEVRIARVLEGLGFPRATWGTPLDHLSGGQKTRALLARLLLESPDLLILDEPTNHLDMEAVQWLEGTLLKWEGALLIVSHDRYFLDRVVNRIWEMSRTSLEVYKGNYSAYVVQRQERWEHRLKTFEETKERLQREVELIRQYIAWRKFVEAKGKLKRVSRELAAISALGVEGVQGKSWSETGVGGVSSLTVEEAHQQVKALRPPLRPPSLTMQLRAAVRSGNQVLRTRGLVVGYRTPSGDKPLFEADDIELLRGECAALIGPNGAGKTTFLKTILGTLAPLAGETTLGASLHIGYFAQAHEALDPQRTVLEEVMARAPLDPGEARSYLAQYLFRGDDVWKVIGSLSGGERGRLALALLALGGANLLLLDEPTNHLDIPSQETLQAALERFDGTILLVSHDRYLVDRLATQVWEIRDTRDDRQVPEKVTRYGRLEVFRGTYREMLAAREAEAQRALKARQEAEDRSREPRAATNSERSSARDERKRAQAIARLEAEIEEREAYLAECERQLQAASEAQKLEDVRRIATAYAESQSRLEALMEEWTALAG